MDHIESFFSQLQDTLYQAEKFRKIYDPVVTFEFNPLIHFFSFGENKLSEILAFLLNPKEKHGQGSLFLELFMKHFKLDEFVKNYDEVEVGKEHPVGGQRRLDVYLNFKSDKFGLGIENKIWAADQPKQLSDYNNFLQHQHGNAYCLFYLTPKGHQPSEESIDAGLRDKLIQDNKLRLHNHSVEMTGLIKDWAKECKSDKVRVFLRDFEQYLHHTINGERFMNQYDTIVDFVLKSGDKQRLETAIKVHEAMDTIFREVIISLKTQLEDLANRRKLELNDFNVEINANWKSFRFRLQEAPKIRV